MRVAASTSRDDLLETKEEEDVAKQETNEGIQEAEHRPRAMVDASDHEDTTLYEPDEVEMVPTGSGRH